MAARRVARLGGLVATGLLAAGCMGAGQDARPRPKPEAIPAIVKQDGKLSAARVSTKSGDILILEPDGSVTEMALDSSGGRNAFDVTEADLAALNVNLGLDLTGMAPEDPAGVASKRPKQPTAQQRALAAFRARTAPALPRLPADLAIVPEDFGGATVARMKRDGEGDSGLVTVTANLRQGVDAELAFAYATCALAGWAAGTDTHFARHVRTLSQRRNGKMTLEAVFTLSSKAPMGLKVMDSGSTSKECRTRGIPQA